LTIKNKRTPIGKKLRFEVFKRDSFTCSYCGKRPPEATLEIDHIDPVVKGGTNEISNLLTSCFDCNRGKGSTELSNVPRSIAESTEEIKERESQIKEYRKYIAQAKKREEKDQNHIASVYSENFPRYELTEKFKKKTVGMFLQKLPLHEVAEAMEIACDYLNEDEDAAIKYFCGICWNKIREQ
jgi:5-methylcytosine-specific restriction endonuclease McrA